MRAAHNIHNCMHVEGYTFEKPSKLNTSSGIVMCFHWDTTGCPTADSNSSPTCRTNPRWGDMCSKADALIWNLTESNASQMEHSCCDVQARASQNFIYGPMLWLDLCLVIKNTNQILLSDVDSETTNTRASPLPNSFRSSGYSLQRIGTTTHIPSVIMRYRLLAYCKTTLLYNYLPKYAVPVLIMWLLCARPASK